MVESVSTKVTAPPIPMAVSNFFDTPRNGQMPRNCDSTTLLTKMADINIKRYSIVYFFNVSYNSMNINPLLS